MTGFIWEQVMTNPADGKAVLPALNGGTVKSGAMMPMLTKMQFKKTLTFQLNSNTLNT